MARKPWKRAEGRSSKLSPLSSRQHRIVERLLGRGGRGATNMAENRSVPQNLSEYSEFRKEKIPERICSERINLMSTSAPNFIIDLQGLV